MQLVKVMEWLELVCVVVAGAAYGLGMAMPPRLGGCTARVID
jgi:hypothetical protein